MQISTITDAPSYVLTTSFDLRFNLEITLCTWLKRSSEFLFLLKSVKSTNLSSNLTSCTYLNNVDNCQTLPASEASSYKKETNGAFRICIVMSSNIASWIDWIKSFWTADYVAMNTVAVSLWSFRTVSYCLRSCTNFM